MMRFTAGVLTSACALGASAFLIPPDIALSSNNDDIAFSFSPPINTKSQTIQVPCSSCAFPSPHSSADLVESSEDDLFWIQAGVNSLVMEFSISEDGTRLLLNDGSIFSLNFPNLDGPAKVMVPQIPFSSSVEAFRANKVQATMLQVTTAITTVEEHVASADGDSVVLLTYYLRELEKQPMTVDGISVRMLKTSDEELMIMEVSNVPGLEFKDTTPLQVPDIAQLPDEIASMTPVSAEGSTDCGMLCRLKDMIGSRITELKDGKIKGCTDDQPTEPARHHNQLPSHRRPHFYQSGHDGEPRRHYGRPHHMRPYEHHHHRHHSHHFLHAFVRGVAAILIPTLAGIAVGMAVSLLGLFVGRLIGFVWIKSVRGGRRGYARVPAEESDNHKYVTDEIHNEPPPVYEEAPAYEDAIAPPK